MKSITLGRYTPYNSFIHRMDPRNKIFCLIVLMVAVFISYSTWEMTFIIGGFLAFVTLLLAIVSHTSFKQLFGSLKTLWFIIIVLLIINVLIPPKDAVDVAFNIGSLPVYWDSIFQSLKIILRLVLMLTLTMILTSTTKPLDLTYALEWYMTPLKLIKFPAHEVAMTISIALRFIPTLLDETDRIMKAQSSRGVDFKHGKISSRLKAIVSLIVPLFVSSFQRSEELADSMEARGYDPKIKRTRYHVMKWQVSDCFVFVLCAAIMSGTIIVNHFKFTISTETFLGWYFIALSFIIVFFIVFGIIESWRMNR